MTHRTPLHRDGRAWLRRAEARLQRLADDLASPPAELVAAAENSADVAFILERAAAAADGLTAPLGFLSEGLFADVADGALAKKVPTTTKRGKDER